MFTRLIRLFYAQKRFYKSDIQNFLDTFDEQNPLSDSQKAEIRKHTNIHCKNTKAKKKKNQHLAWLDDEDIT